MYKFLLKVNEDDRDCVKYIEIDRIGKFECGHYFASFIIHGACFCGFEEEIRQQDFENFTTILTKRELERLFEFNDKINELGYGITEGDERYQKGLEYRAEIQDIIDKLKGEENEKLFKKVQEEERECLKEEYDLTDEDIDNIFANYSLDYRDRAVVGCVFRDIDDLGYEEARNFDLVNDSNERYFDYELFGKDLLEEERYVELDDGRVVALNY